MATRCVWEGGGEACSEGEGEGREKGETEMM